MISINIKECCSICTHLTVKNDKLYCTKKSKAADDKDVCEDFVLCDAVVEDTFFDIHSITKSCDDCTNSPANNGGNYPLECGECSRFYGDKFEEKKRCLKY